MGPEILEIARRFQPHAEEADLHVVGEGQLCVAVRVEDVVFRLPRSEFAGEHLRDEIRILDHIRPLLDHALPDVLDADFEGPRAFVAHRYLAGSPLTPEVVNGLSDSKLATVATETASFLRDLHSVRIPELREWTNRQFADFLMGESQQFLRPRMGIDRWTRVDTELHALANVVTGRLGLCHTDIGGNVLYDDATESVSFIDFGSAMIADPVLDVASLSVLGPRFTALCADAYPLIAERSGDARIVQATFQLQDALYGARQGDWPYVDDVLSTY
jgi:aminoglycoside phosphotransferase (APT) family kinase protein